MKIQAIHNRVPLLPSNAFGMRDGKVYYGKFGEDFTPPIFYEDIPNGRKGLYYARTNAVPECFEGASTQSGYRDLLGYGFNRGVRNSQFLSTKGATAGKYFLHANCGIQTADGSAIPLISVLDNVSSPSRALDLVSEILYETDTHFITFVRLSNRGEVRNGLTRLFAINKAPNATPVLLLSGYFDVVYLGTHKTTKPTGRPCFAVFSNHIDSSISATGSIPITLTTPTNEGSQSDGNGCNLHLLSLENEVNPQLQSSWSWLYQRRLGVGHIRGMYGGLKYQLGSDSSLVVRDVAGVITRFSYVGYAPEIEAETFNYPNTGGPYQNGLQQNLALNHIDFSVRGDNSLPRATVTYEPIVLPASWMLLQWDLSALPGVRDLCASFISGRAWRVDNTLYSIMGLGNSHRYVRSAPSERAQPLPTIVLLTADVDANNVMANLQLTELPSQLGDACIEGLYLLSEDRKCIWMPDIEKDSSRIGVINLRNGTPEYEVVSLPERHSRYGTVGEDLLVETAMGRPYLLSLGTVPSTVLSFDKGEYVVGDDGVLTVTADAPCTVTIAMYRCTFNGASEVTVLLEANTPTPLAVKIFGAASAHVVSVE